MRKVIDIFSKMEQKMVQLRLEVKWINAMVDKQIRAMVADIHRARFHVVKEKKGGVMRRDLEHEKSLLKESEQLLRDIKWIKKKTDQLNRNLNKLNNKTDLTLA
jgi:hypothetical protein